MNDIELIESGIFYEYEEDDASFSELNLSEEYPLFEYLDDHGTLLKSKKNGFYNAYSAYYDSNAIEEVVYLYEIPDGKYIVHGQEECINGDGASELSFPIYITTSYEKALDYYNNVMYQEAPIEAQMKKAHQILDGEISGLWFDAKSNGYPGCFAWNIKIDYNLLIEKARDLNPDEIRSVFKRYKESLQLCFQKQIHFQGIYKKPREWNQNQRYYVFEFFAGGKEWKYEAHIPSKMQHKKRITLDYLKDEWLSEMEKAEKEFLENGGAKCEIYIKEEINQLKIGDIIVPGTISKKFETDLYSVYNELESYVQKGVLKNIVALFCPNCNQFLYYETIADIPEEVKCSSCEYEFDNPLKDNVVLYKKISDIREDEEEDHLLNDDNFHHIVLSVPKNATKIVMTTTVMDGDSINRMEGTYDLKALHKARDMYLQLDPDDDFFGYWVLNEKNLKNELDKFAIYGG